MPAASATQYLGLDDQHAADLIASAIDPAWAVEQGVYTARTADQLPPDLARSFPDPETAPVPGIVFPLRRLDGTVMNQIRLDRPDPDGPKYLQPADTGAVIIVPAAVASRVGSARRLLLVEGTKQTMAAARYVAEDTLVAGIQGCWNWGKDGIPNASLVELLAITPVDTLEVLFDADITSNPAVWEAADRLRRAVQDGLGAVKRVKFVRVAAVAGKDGIDDHLGRLDEGQRATALEGMRKAAKATIGRRPARKARTNDGSKKTSGPKRHVSDMDRATTYTLVTDPESGDERRIVHLPTVAARIAYAEILIDEHNSGALPPAMLTLDVAVLTDDGTVLQMPRAVRVASTDLADVRSWIDRLPNHVGIGMPRPLRPSEEVDTAIRATSSDMVYVRVLPRLGWARAADGSWRWVAPSGGIGPDDLDTSLVASPPSEDYESINLPDPGDVTHAELRTAVRDFIMARKLFSDAGMWDVAIAAFGAAFLPWTPQCAVGFFGEKGSGKSTVAQGLMTCLNPQWGPRRRPMATFDASAAAMDLLASGLNSAILHVDDLKPEKDQRTRLEILKGVDALMRRAHGAGGRRRGKIDRQSGRLGTRATDDATPLVILTGEEVPTGGDFAGSGLDRMLVVDVPASGMFASTDGDDGRAALRRFYALVEQGSFPTVTSAYLSMLASEMGDGTHAREAMSAACERERADLVDELMADGALDAAHVSSRGVILIASLLTGFERVIRLAQSVGSIDADEAGTVRVQARARLVSLAVRHADSVMDGNADAGTVLLDRLRAGVAGGAFSLDEAAGVTAPVIGRRVKSRDGGEMIALNHKYIAELLRYPTGPAGVLRDLAKHAVRGRDGRDTQNYKVGGVQIRVVCLPLEVWTLGADGEWL